MHDSQLLTSTRYKELVTKHGWLRNSRRQMEMKRNEIKGLVPNINAVPCLVAITEVPPVGPVELKWGELVLHLVRTRSSGLYRSELLLKILILYRIFRMRVILYLHRATQGKKSPDLHATSGIRNRDHIDHSLCVDTKISEINKKSSTLPSSEVTHHKAE